ncbi:uncharacterized protein LOC112035658 isoform X1 [Quercus suber]|uniref:uncharacterized protein LOC112035658 isoform X1 n=1 Tax=Quercus suber TaxID=58331 RepID=UPI0032DEE9E5
MQQQSPDMLNNGAPSILANTNITIEQIQKYLDENIDLILAIMENQNVGKFVECAQSVMDFHFFYVYYDGETYYHELHELSYQGSNQKQKCVKVKRRIGLMSLKRRILKAMGLNQSRHNIFVVYQAPQLVVGTQVVYNSLQLSGGAEVKMMWEVVEQMVVKGFIASELYVTVEPTIVKAGEGSQQTVLDGTVDEHIDSIPLQSY